MTPLQQLRLATTCFFDMTANSDGLCIKGEGNMRVLVCCLFMFACGLARSEVPCPTLVHPTWGKRIDAIISTGRGYDAIKCIAEIEASGILPEHTDELRYDVAQKMSDAMYQVYGQRRALPIHNRLAADLWSVYLTHASESEVADSLRAKTATKNLILHSRYVKFDSYIVPLMRGIRRSGSSIDTELANLLYSTAKRCPDWSQVKVENHNACTSVCLEFTNKFLDNIEQTIGQTPWSGSQGLNRLELNHAAMRSEVKTCSAR